MSSTNELDFVPPIVDSFSYKALSDPTALLRLRDAQGYTFPTMPLNPDDITRFLPQGAPGYMFPGVPPYYASVVGTPLEIPVTTNVTPGAVENAPATIDPIEIRYHFLDVGHDAQKAHVGAVCNEWGVWANVSFVEVDEAGLAAPGVLGGLGDLVVAAVKAEADADKAINNAQLTAITTARDKGVLGAGASLAGPRTREDSRKDWSVIDRALATAAENRASGTGELPAFSAREAPDITAARQARVAVDLVRTREATLNTAFEMAGRPEVPPVRFISFKPYDQWSFSGCGQVPMSAALSTPYSLAPLMIYLSMSDVAHDNNDQRLKAKIDHDRGTILHELGHTLGFQHEHTSPSREGVFTITQGAFGNHYRWDTPGSLDVDTLHNILAYSRFDKESIMVYHLPKAATTLGETIRRPDQLSTLDKAYAMLLYPRPIARGHAPDGSEVDNPPKHAMSLIGIPENHPAYVKILEMYEFLANTDAVDGSLWRGVKDEDMNKDDHRIINIIQTIRHTLSTWSLARGAAARARLALEAAIKAQVDVQAKYEADGHSRGVNTARLLQDRLKALVLHQKAAEQDQEFP